MIFYFSGFIALAVFISKLLFCRGTVCGAARADVVFGAFEFALWIGTSAFLAKDVVKSGFRGGLKLGGSGAGASSSAPGSGPQMKESQVA